MKKGTIFPLAEYGSLAPNPPTPPQFFEATGEIRPAKVGEWFISGAIPEAYYCVHDHDKDERNHIAVPTVAPEKEIKVGGLRYRLVM
jgi:hypothetical protein